MHLNFTTKLKFQVYYTNINIKKNDDSRLDNVKIVIAFFQ